MYYEYSSVLNLQARAMSTRLTNTSEEQEEVVTAGEMDVRWAYCTW